MILGITGWLIVGLVVGLIAAKIVNLHGDDPRLGLAVACGGSIVAAFLYTVISGVEVRAVNVWALLFAAIGAIVGAVVWHLVRSRFVSHAPYSRRTSY